MVVYNRNPEGTSPIVITTKWLPNPNGAAMPLTTYMIMPGQGIDLQILGLLIQEEWEEIREK